MELWRPCLICQARTDHLPSKFSSGWYSAISHSRDKIFYTYKGIRVKYGYGMLGPSQVESKTGTPFILVFCEKWTMSVFSVWICWNSWEIAMTCPFLTKSAKCQCKPLTVHFSQIVDTPKKERILVQVLLSTWCYVQTK